MHSQVLGGVSGCQRVGLRTEWGEVWDQQRGEEKAAEFYRTRWLMQTQVHWALRTAATMQAWEQTGGRPESDNWHLPNWGLGPPGKFRDVGTKVKSNNRLVKIAVEDALKQVACCEWGLDCCREDFESDAIETGNSNLVRTVKDNGVWSEIEIARQRRKRKKAKQTGPMGVSGMCRDDNGKQKRTIKDPETVKEAHGGRLDP